MEQFRKLGLSEQMLKSIQEHNFETPSEIQEKTIPLVLAGNDVIAGASTGSGKTLAFGSAILQNCKKDFGIQALVLTPTRELAEQISKALIRFSKHNPLRIIPVYGGVSINPQIDDLERAEVVIGTPGRILDHMERETIDLTHLKILVLDEADRMLDMGFKDDVEKIIFECPEKRQTLLYSATISEDITRLAHRYMHNPIEVAAEAYVDATKLIQVYYDVDDNLKYSLLVHLLKNEDSKLAMVFCNTRRNVDFVSNNLRASGIDALPIHGGFSQDKRNKILEKFHGQNVRVLVCTDVAARGLDIKGVSHVYNYDIPSESKEYVHRIGRTARAGKDGKVINIVASRDYENFRSVLKNDELKIEKAETPYLERTAIKWMPERRQDRGGMGRRSFRAREEREGRSNNFRDNNSGRSRSSYGRSGSRDDRSFGRSSGGSRYSGGRSDSRGYGRGGSSGERSHSRDSRHSHSGSRSSYGSGRR